MKISNSTDRLGLEANRPGWIEVSGRRVCLFDVVAGLTALNRAYFDEVGVDAGFFLYEAGIRMATAWSAELNAKSPLERLSLGLEALLEHGFGSFQIVEETGELARASVVATDTLEASAHRTKHGPSSKPKCQLSAGLLAGLWCMSLGSTESSDVNIVGWEVECAAMGGSVCRFELGPAARLSELGFQNPFEIRSVRWELQELARNLKASDQTLSSLRGQLAQREAQHQYLLDNMNDLLLVLDRDRKVLFCNKRFLEATGIRPDEAIGSRPLDLIDRSDYDRVSQIYDELLTGQRRTATYTFRARAARGEMYIESSARALAGSDGTVEGIEILARDVSEREKVRREMELAHDTLIRKQETADNDLRMAKRVHESLLPGPVKTKEVDVDVKYVPAARVGGDYCHIVFPYSRSCLLTMCDVSGHGMASALLAARVSSHVRILCETKPDPLTITMELNQFLRTYFGDTGLFVTFFAAAIDLDTFQVKYCGAGHPGALLFRRRTNTVETLLSQNLPVGIVDEFLRDPPIGQTKLRKGDRLVLFTDGVTETMGNDRMPLRSQGLEAWVEEGAHVPLFELGNWLLSRIKEFRGSGPRDDISLLLLEAKQAYLADDNG